MSEDWKLPFLSHLLENRMKSSNTRLLDTQGRSVSPSSEPVIEISHYLDVSLVEAALSKTAGCQK
jgi:hypothetical protein